MYDPEEAWDQYSPGSRDPSSPGSRDQSSPGSRDQSSPGNRERLSPVSRDRYPSGGGRVTGNQNQLFATDESSSKRTFRMAESSRKSGNSERPVTPDLKAGSSSASQRLAEYRAKYRVKQRRLSPSTTPASPQPPAPVVAPRPHLPPFQPPPPQHHVWQCRICSNTVDTESLFQVHLTTTHFRERILKRIKPPFKCLLCGFQPPPTMSDSEKSEDLLIHYGIVERISVKFYEEVCGEMVDEAPIPAAATKEEDPAKECIDCNICDLSLDNERSFRKHLTLRHFPKQLCDDLPKNFPFRCPFIDCHQSRQNLHGLMIHYGVDHNISLELYRKHPKCRTGVAPSGGEMPPDGRVASCDTGGINRVELLKANRFPKLQAVVPPYHPETEDRTSSASPSSSSSLSAREASLDLHSITAASPGPSGSQGVTGRAKLLKNWQNNSLEVQKSKIEELEEKIKEMDTLHKEKLKEKEKEFERWITVKESAIETETSKNKDMAKCLEEKDEEIKSLQSQLDMVHDNFSKVEEDFDRKNKLCEELFAYREEVEKELQSKEEERINSYEELYQKEKEVEALEEKLQLKEQSIESLSKDVEEKENCLSEIKVKMKNLFVDLNAKSEQLEEQTKLLAEKDKESLKDTVEKFGFAFRTVRDSINSDGSELDVANLDMEKESVMETMTKLQIVMKDLNKTMADKNAEIACLKEKLQGMDSLALELEQKSEQNKNLEKEKKESGKKVKTLEKTLADWETRQFTNVKLISGLEKERDALQVKLKEQQDGKLSHEDQLYWKDVAIRNKEKELKSATGELAELRAKLEAAESDLKAQTTESQELRDKFAQMEADLETERSHPNLKDRVDQLEAQLANKTSEIKHLKISLTQKNQDLSTMNTTAMCQKAELERIMKENERFESDYSKAIAQLEVVKKGRQDLEKQVRSKELEARRLELRLKKSLDRERVLSLRIEERQQRRMLGEEENRLEQEMMNQVLSDMDKVINSKEFENGLDSDGIQVKQEPVDDLQDYSSSSPATSEFPLHLTSSISGISSHSFSTTEDIVLQSDDILEQIKHEPHDHDDEEEVDIDESMSPPPPPTTAAASAVALACVESPAPRTTVIAPWPAFVTVGSHPELAVRRRNNKRRSTALSAEAAVTVGSSSAAVKESAAVSTPDLASLPLLVESSAAAATSQLPPDHQPVVKKGRSNVEDVTELYKESEEGQYLCGICESWDPPDEAEGTPGAKKKKQTTQWVGCDCERWYHKTCTKLKRVTTKFTCKSVKMECLQPTENILVD